MQIELRLNQHQYKIIEDLMRRGYGSSDEEVLRAVLDSYDPEQEDQDRSSRSRRTLPSGEGRQIASRHELPAGTGRAVELQENQVLRVEQIERGGQCVDLNVYNLHDYREHFSAGRTRHFHGLSPTKGHKLWSAPPRERPLLTIVEDTAGTNDVNFARCSACVYEVHFYQEAHPNCHDIFAEAIGAYGLTSDDVHDSFNIFMNTAVSESGEPYIAPLKVDHGDYVEFLAHTDVLCVMVACPSDIFPTSNYVIKNIGLSIWEGSEEDKRFVEEEPKFLNQKTPEDFRVSEIRTERELTRDPDYEPDFSRSQFESVEVNLHLTQADRRKLNQLRQTYGHDHSFADEVRSLLMSYWVERYARWL